MNTPAIILLSIALALAAPVALAAPDTPEVPDIPCVTQGSCDLGDPTACLTSIRSCQLLP